MADDQEQPEGQQLNIELSEAMAEGVYSNLAIITHNPTEFVVDFVQILPNVPKGKVRSRVILNPLHAKRLMRALTENVGKYEAQFGVIKDPTQARGDFPPMSFNFPAGEA